MGTERDSISRDFMGLIQLYRCEQNFFSLILLAQASHLGLSMERHYWE